MTDREPSAAEVYGVERDSAGAPPLSADHQTHGPDAMRMRQSSAVRARDRDGVPWQGQRGLHRGRLPQRQRERHCGCHGERTGGDGAWNDQQSRN